MKFGSQTTKFGLLKAVGGRMHVQIDVDPIGNENTLMNIWKALIFKLLQFLEETRAKIKVNMASHPGGRAHNNLAISAIARHQTPETRNKMKKQYFLHVENDTRADKVHAA